MKKKKKNLISISVQCAAVEYSVGLVKKKSRKMFAETLEMNTTGILGDYLEIRYASPAYISPQITSLDKKIRSNERC